MPDRLHGEQARGLPRRVPGREHRDGQAHQDDTGQIADTITAGLEDKPDPTEDEARDMIAGNLCRCTGYLNIVKSVLRAAELGSST